MTILLGAVMGLSTIALTILLFATGGWPAWHAYGWAASAASGLLNLVALYFLYRALANGPVAVASPIASSFSVILVAMNGLAGEPLVWQQGLAIAIVFLGVTMLSRGPSAAVDFPAAHVRTTAMLALAAAITIALRMFLAQDAAEALGALPALYLNRAFALCGVVVLLAYDLARSHNLQMPPKSMIGLVLLQAALETLALASFLLGSEGDGRVGATIGFASFAAITALTAWIWLGEPVGWRRGFWMAVISGGIAVAVLAGPR